MYCRNCGAEMNDNQAACLNCGFASGNGNQYCQHCGSSVNPNAAICVKCGSALGQVQGNGGNQGQIAFGVSTKTKTVAGLLYVLPIVGWLGIGDFYLGFTSKGVIKLLVSLLGLVTVIAPFGMWIWSVIDGVKVFQGNGVDSKGLKLKE